MRTTSLRWVAAIGLIALAGAPARAAGGPEWRDILNCGPNCLYMLLSLKGQSVSYRAVRDAVPVGPHGSTLEDLRRAAARFGVDAAVVRCGVEELTPFLPAIVHVDPMDGGEGHFVLLLGAKGDVFYAVETSNAEVVPMPRVMFVNEWTGTAMVVRASRWAGLWPIGAGTVAVPACLTLITLRRRTTRRAVARERSLA